MGIVKGEFDLCEDFRQGILERAVVELGITDRPFVERSEGRLI